MFLSGEGQWLCNMCWIIVLSREVTLPLKGFVTGGGKETVDGRIAKLWNQKPKNPDKHFAKAMKPMIKSLHKSYKNESMLNISKQ